MSTFSINTTFADLVESLGAILRRGLGFKVIYAPCWDFKFHEDYPPPHTYLGKGHFFSKIAEKDRDRQGGDEDTVLVRVQCILTDAPDPNVWVFLIWVKLPNGAIRSYCFESVHGDLPQLNAHQTAPAIPPEELKF